MEPDDADAPFVDEHELSIAQPRERVWIALESFVRESLLSAADGVPGRLLGTEPPGGFAIDAVVPSEQIALVGRHDFSRYRLVFAVAADGEGATRLSARSYAAFPGPHGAVYRLLVIRSRFHVLATRRMLRQVRDRADRPAPDST